MNRSGFWRPFSRGCSRPGAPRSRSARDTLSVNAAGLVRYLFGLPVAVLLLAGYAQAAGVGALPEVGPRFLGMCLLAGLVQILATNLLIMAFGYRNFVVGTAYFKTEAVQGAVLAMLLTGERLAALAGSVARNSPSRHGPDCDRVYAV